MDNTLMTLIFPTGRVESFMAPASIPFTVAAEAARDAYNCPSLIVVPACSFEVSTEVH